MKYKYYILLLFVIATHSTFSLGPDSTITQRGDKVKLTKKEGGIKNGTHFLALSGFFALEPFTPVSNTGRPLGYSGLTAKIKLWNLYASARLNYFNKVISEQQVMGAFSNNEYSAGVVFDAGTTGFDEGFSSIGFIVGYHPNNWVKSIESTARDASNPNHITAIDANGRYYDLKNTLIKTRIPTYSFALKILGGKKTKLFQNDDDYLDDYDRKHSGKLTCAMLYDMNIAFLYAPKISYDTTMIYSPYGFYTPRTLYLSKHFKEKRFGVNLQVAAHFPYGVGIMIEMGLNPGIINLDDDFSKVNLSVKAGVLFNLMLVK